ncbi:hypothetical protein D3C80_1995380 [compost metagenome]
MGNSQNFIAVSVNQLHTDSGVFVIRDCLGNLPYYRNAQRLCRQRRQGMHTGARNNERRPERGKPVFQLQVFPALLEFADVRL